MRATEEHTWFRVPNVVSLKRWQEEVFNKQYTKGMLLNMSTKKDNMFEQYQHALKADKDNFLARRRKNAIMVSERDKKINQSQDRIHGYQTDNMYTEPQASQNEKEMLKEQVEEPKIQVQECQVKI
ncbi:hypothetical protein GQ457_10G000700 [Hibiscus cannabinus]